MCQSPTCRHNDPLDDDLDGLFDGPAMPLVIAPVDTAPKGALIDAPFRAVAETARAAAGHRYEERCDKCRGTGRWSSYSGLTRGECFACKGKGKLVFKSSPEARQKAAEARDNAKAKKALTIREGVLGWKDEHEAEWDWMHEAAKRGFDFAASMIESLHKYGSLTPKQLAAVQSATAKSLARQQQFAQERVQREASAAAIDITKIVDAFASAMSKGIKRPKITLTGIKFSMAPVTGRNAGSLYVVATDSDQYLGRITEGRFIKVRECSAEQEAEVLRVAADPHAAAVAHGQRTGNCCICNRELTNHASIDAGIGPICASRFGW
jgi:hypothetical protein